jgi:hypothetical protein
MTERERVLQLIEEIEFIEQQLAKPHHITGEDRKRALMGAADIYRYLRTRPVFPQPKDGTGAQPPSNEGTNATPTS